MEADGPVVELVSNESIKTRAMLQMDAAMDRALKTQKPLLLLPLNGRIKAETSDGSWIVGDPSWLSALTAQVCQSYDLGQS